MSRFALGSLMALAGWVAVVVAVAATDGFLVDSDVPPWPIMLAVAVPIVVFVALFRREPVRRAVLGIDPRLVLAVQLWRVVGAAFLFGWADGDLDAGFAVPAGIGDIATGVAALAVLALLLAGTLARRHLVAFTVLGLGDFAVALATGALVRPDGLEELPWVLFPALAVPFFAAVHLVNWVQLGHAIETRCTPRHFEAPDPTSRASRSVPARKISREPIS